MNKCTIWIFALEPIQTRYTGQWHEYLPKLLSSKLGDKFNVVQVDGIQKNTQTTPGAFLNFSDTNYWKSSQLCNFLDHYNRGETSTNDHFLFTDFWNPTVIQLKYMKDLLGFNWLLHGMVHAGSYDSADFLGRIVGSASWVRHAEKSFYHAFDHNYFATEFHVRMFMEELLNNGIVSENPWFDEDWDERYSSGKIIRTGWPMEYMDTVLTPYKGLRKRDLILFPHRVAPEKQVEIFRDLKEHLPQYEFIVCQDQQLTKSQYHNLLGESKLVFSANLQETLGISTCSEGPLVNAIPLAPDRLSYSEIFKNHQDFLYPSEWTLDWDHYMLNRSALIERIVYVMENYNDFLSKILNYNLTTHQQYFNATKLIENIKHV